MTTPTPPYTDADVQMIASAMQEHALQSARTDADGNSPCACNLWWDSPADVSWDEHMADVALAVLADAGRLLPADCWAVPKIAHDESRLVGPNVHGGWVHRSAGQSDPEHTRFYAAQLLAAADAAEVKP